MSPYVIPGLKSTLISDEDRVDHIISIVVSRTNISPELILGRTRKMEVVLARFICLRLIRNSTKLTLKKIGQKFGIDHTSVLHGLKTLQDRIDTEPWLLAEVEQIRKNVHP